MENFISTITGALVGAVAALGGSVLVTYRVFRNERDLAREAAQDQRDMMLEASARDAAVVLLDTLATMRAHLGSIGESEWHVVSGDWVRRTERRPDPPPGVAALHDVRRQDTSRAQLLPKELGNRWYELVLLLDEYRSVLVGDRADWPDPKLNRAGADIPNYMAYVRDSLAEFVRTGAITKHCDPPRLRRDDPESWIPC